MSSEPERTRSARPPVTTNIATYDLHHIWVRGVDLTGEAMGQLSFGGMVFLLLQGRVPEPSELRIVDAVLVALVEHGLTPSAVITRMTYSLAPESVQAAVAAGLTGVGSRVLGTMEDCGRILHEIQLEVSSGGSRQAAIDRVVGEYRAAGERLPGIGHAIHTDGDPRAARLAEIAVECGLSGNHLDCLEAISAAARLNKPLPVNVTGAVAAVLLELGIPWQLHRGFALVARSAGLVAHIAEEMESPITPAIREFLRGELERVPR